MRTFIATFIVRIEDENATLEDVKNFLDEALVVDLDIESAGNAVEAVAAEVLVNDLSEKQGAENG